MAHHEFEEAFRRLKGIPKDKKGLSWMASVRHDHNKNNTFIPSSLSASSNEASSNTSRLNSHPAYEQEYHHQKLDTNNNEIRLLKLSCKYTEEELVGSLECVPFEEAPPYDALSYTWDSSTTRRSIKLDGKRFSVTPNLLRALKRLCLGSRRSHITLWIDAICINQHDSSERNHQVSKMRYIYERAVCVRIWLGEGYEASNLAFDLARDLAKAAEVRQEGELFHDPRRIDQFAAFQALLHRGYWNRIWVIQEVNAAKEAEVICGQDTIPWKDLLAAQNAIVSNRDECWKLVRDNPRMAKFASDVYYEGPRGLVIQCDAQTPTLFEALRWHCTKISTQPEDRIYGLLGLTTAGSDSKFILDYSRSIRQIYIDAAVYIIETTRNLDVICIMQAPAQQSLVPCWVPDWLNGTPSWLLDSSIDLFDASMNHDAIASFNSDGSILVAKGFCIGSIVTTGSVLLLNEENDSESVSHLLSKFHEWRQLLSLRGASIDTVDLEAFCRTFTCARIMEELDLLAGLPQDHVLRIMLGIFVQLSRKSYTDHYLGSNLCTLADETKNLATIDKLEAWARVILLDVRAIINRRRFIITNNKAIGMACQFANGGDKVCILLGCSTPVILRPMTNGYRFIGDSYVDGYMFGRGMLEAEAGEYCWEEFSLY